MFLFKYQSHSMWYVPLIIGGAVPYLCPTQMFQTPMWLTMSIAATRMHRSLVDYTSGSTDMCDTLTPFRSPTHCGQCSFSAQETVQHSKLSDPKSRQIPAASTSLDRMEVAVHVVSEQHRSRQMSSDDSCIDAHEPEKRETEPIKPR